jgi:hypothetical protein
MRFLSRLKRPLRPGSKEAEKEEELVVFIKGQIVPADIQLIHVECRVLKWYANHITCTTNNQPKGVSLYHQKSIAGCIIIKPKHNILLVYLGS